MNPDQNKAPMVEAGEASFESEVLRSEAPVLVAFWAPWSRPCHILEAVLDEVARACGGRVKLVKIDADDNPDLSLWYEIQSIPTLLYFVDGRPRARLVGTASKEAIMAKLQTVFRGEAAEPSHPHPGQTNEQGER
jgi:thioredoxin 1